MSVRDKERREERELDRLEVLALQKRRNLLNGTFSTGYGKEVLRQLMIDNHFFSTTFTNSGVTSFREGERNVVLKLLADVPQLVGEVIMEHCAELEAHIQQTLTEKLSND